MSINFIFKQELRRIAKEHGFTPRRNAYFKVVGDGILQLLKFEYEFRCESHYLRVGLYSMYDGFFKEHQFTPGGCVPQFFVGNFAGHSERNCFSWNWPTSYPITIITPEEQLSLLQENALPELEGMKTQNDLLNIMTRLYFIEDKQLRTNNYKLFWPYLLSGNYEAAEKTIESILDQHYNAYECNKRVIKDYVVKDYMLEEDRQLEELLDLARSRDEKRIDQVKQSNYQRNMEYAKFCMKK